MKDGVKVYMGTLPDHWDRFIWRGDYYMLPWNNRDELKKLQAYNLSLANRCALLDHAIRSIAEAAGMTEAFTGVDFDPECGVLVERVRAIVSDANEYRKLGHDVFEVSEFYEEDI